MSGDEMQQESDPAAGAAEVPDTVLLDYATLIRAVESLGIPLPAQRLVRTPQEATAFCAQLGRRAVLKLISPGLVHKSDAGGVRLGLVGESAVFGAATELAALAESLGLGRSDWQILVQEMSETTEVEVYVGLKRDRTFGPVVIVGAGGRLVELLPQRAIRRCPVSASEARQMLAETPLEKMLGGYRGSRDSAGAVAEVISKVSRLAERIDGLEEADFNPLMVTAAGPVAVDVRAVVSATTFAAPARPAAAARSTTALDLRPLLEPRSILVIGASAAGALMPGNRVLNYLRQRGYAGRVHVVHPSASQVGGFPAVPSIEDLADEDVELVCVAVGATACVDIIRRCGAIGIKAAVVLSSGFAEVGNTLLETELATAARQSGVLLCGPNTVGVMSPGQHVHVCFSQAQDVETAHVGGIAFVVQSGALGGSFVAQAWQRGIGVSRFISVGNQATLTSTDYLDYLVTDASTQTVAMLLEGVTDGNGLLMAAERLRDAGKSLIVLKAGRTAEGAKAVQSHTGSIAGDYAVYRAVLAHAGATLVDSITELLDLLELKHAGVKIAPGARMAVLSTSGGACAMVADLCQRYGFRIPELSAALRQDLAAVLPAFATSTNPIDVTGHVVTDPGIYERALALVLRSDEIDAVTIMLTTIADPQAEQIANKIVAQVVGQSKPVLVCWTIPPQLARGGLAVFARASMPVFDDPARAIHAASLASR